MLLVVVAVVRWWFTMTMRATDAMKMNETFSTKVHFYTLSLEEEEEASVIIYHHHPLPGRFFCILPIVSHFSLTF